MFAILLFAGALALVFANHLTVPPSIPAVIGILSMAVGIVAIAGNFKGARASVVAGAAIVGGCLLALFGWYLDPFIVCENCALNDTPIALATVGVVIALSGLMGGLFSLFGARAGRAFMVAGLLLIVGVAASMLSACTDTQVAKTNATLDKYDHSIDNFNAVAGRVNASVAKTDDTVKPYCSDALDAGKNVSSIVKGNDKAETALDAVTSALGSYCAGPVQNASAAVVALTKAIAVAKDVYQNR